MKEVTKWDNNPREMWVWDSSFEEKEKAKVIYIAKSGLGFGPVMTIDKDNIIYCVFKHCAEIEEPKIRRMTNKELARWLKEKPTREFKYNNCDDNCIHSYLYYYESNADKEVDESVVIREDDGEWREPLVEVEE